MNIIFHPVGIISLLDLLARLQINCFFCERYYIEREYFSTHGGIYSQVYTLILNDYPVQPDIFIKSTRLCERLRRTVDGNLWFPVTCVRFSSPEHIRKDRVNLLICQDLLFHTTDSIAVPNVIGAYSRIHTLTKFHHYA